MKHTKGNWKVLKGNYTHAATINKDVLTRICAIEIGFGHAEDWEANAKLIAAAPELYEQLRITLETLNNPDKLNNEGLMLARKVSIEQILEKATL